ncbi:MAG: 23S rRNA (guanosine(2251)-2'-O)-methyltransferase RlmB [Candidatus Gastranaerophilaceae bacterium]|jgi:23S rRNA (guanosine2251-2'-O)-methyltransferase
MQDQEIIYGKNAVEALIDSDNTKSINKILVLKNIKFDQKLKKIVDYARKNKILVQEVPKEKLNIYAKDSHQGIVALVSPITYTELHEFIYTLKNKQDNSLVVILDGVQDPHNLGAIIRTAKCAGADAVIIPQRRSASINSTVNKSSAGAISLIPIIQVTNINQCIETLKENNFWIVGVESTGDKNYFDVDFNMNCAIVLGGEDEGISKLVQKNCDIITKIPMPGAFNSLNVSNAASIILFEFVRQKLSKN